MASLLIKPRCASSAASVDMRAALPGWVDLTIVPLLANRPPVRERAWRCWGLGRVRHLFDFHVRIPWLAERTQCSIEGLDTSLPQPMRTAFRPLPLLLRTQAFAHHLVHRRLHEPRG